MSGIADIERKWTRPVRVGGFSIGGLHPVVVQEMTTSRPADLAETLRELRELSEAGCRLVRLAVPDFESARAISEIKKHVSIPLVGDVHFNEELALAALERGIDKLRINPGNIRSAKGISRIAHAARERGVPIRIGVNSGSIAREVLNKYGGPTAGAMVESALKEVSLLEKLTFYDIVISLKSTDIGVTVEANKLISAKVDYPLHIGITEAGFGEAGVMRSAVGLSSLLLNGIGDTVRISLTSRDKRENLRVCYSILELLRVPHV